MNYTSSVTRRTINFTEFYCEYTMLEFLVMNALLGDNSNLLQYSGKPFYLYSTIMMFSLSRSWNLAS